MRNSLTTGIASLALLAGVATLMFTAAASARPASMAELTIAMHDPGCHWFVTGPASHRKWTKTRVMAGPVHLLNLDEAPLIIKGPNGTVREKVGATIVLRAKGVYHITMLKQASDDNHLKLTVS